MTTLESLKQELDRLKFKGEDMRPVPTIDNFICSSHPYACCLCCGELQEMLRAEITLYMENEKEWQKVLELQRKVREEAENLIKEIEESEMVDAFLCYEDLKEALSTPPVTEDIGGKGNE